MPVALKMGQSHDRDDVPKVKGPRGWIKAYIAFQGLGGSHFPQTGIGDLFDEPSFLQDIDDVPGQKRLLL